MRSNAVALLAGHARPSDAVLKKLGRDHTPGEVKSIQAALDDLVGIDALSRLLTEGIEKVTTKDGRMDTRDLAAFVLSKMKESPK